MATMDPIFQMNLGMANLENGNIFLYGPPGIGKSTLCGELETLGARSFDLENVDSFSERICAAFNTTRCVFGMADIPPSFDLNHIRRDWRILLFCRQAEYEKRRAARDDLHPGKANQAEHDIGAWLNETYDLVVDTTELSVPQTRAILYVVADALGCVVHYIEEQEETRFPSEVFFDKWNNAIYLVTQKKFQTDMLDHYRKVYRFSLDNYELTYAHDVLEFDIRENWHYDHMGLVRLVPGSRLNGAMRDLMTLAKAHDRLGYDNCDLPQYLSDILG